MIHIQMLGAFGIFIGREDATEQIGKTRKGTALIQYLLLSKGEPVLNAKLYEMLWPSGGSSNPENALKTLVSRVRTILNGVAPGFGQAVASTRGAYRWKMLANMTVDYYEAAELVKRLVSAKALDAHTAEGFARLTRLYKGDLLQGNTMPEWAASRAVLLHGSYLKAICRHIELLKEGENYEEIVNVARVALEIDAFDERLHLELLNALTKTDRNNEALQQYKHVASLNDRYLGVQPPAAIQDFYRQIIRARSGLERNLEIIRGELLEGVRSPGALVCEYPMFKEVYNLQVRNLERLGLSIFLALVMIDSADGEPIPPLRLDEIMKGLIEIMRVNLRRGDVITHHLPDQLALLLPTSNREMGAIAIERVKRLFYLKYPFSNITFNYRLAPLSENSRPLPQS
jgi:DNA-binding SARP family transcriptional activator